MFKKKITIITTIISVILTMTSCGNTTDTEELANTTTSSYSESSIAEEIDTSSDVSSIEEIDSSEDESSETDSSEDSSETDDSSKAEKVTTTIDDSSKVEKTTTTTKKTTSQPARTTTIKTTTEYVETTTQPVVTQAPVTQEPVTTTTVKQTEAPKTTTTVKQTAKPTTTTTKTEAPKKDKYQLAFDKVIAYNNHVGESGYGYTTTDLETIREYYINYAVSKFGSRILNANQKFIPFYDNNGKLTYESTSNQVPATWQYYYGASDITHMKQLIEVYINGWLDGDTTSDLKNESSAWDVFWIIEPTYKTVYFSVAIF